MPDPGAHAGERREIEYKLRLEGPREVEALLRALDPGGDARKAPVVQVNRFFDARAGVLRSRGLVCRLREEGARFFLTAKGPSGSDEEGALANKLEEELELNGDEAAEVCAGRRDPLELFGSRLDSSRSALLRTLRDAAAGTQLVEVGSFRNERTRLGPLVLPGGEVGSEVPLVFELDRTEFPGGEVEHELEVEVGADAAEAVGEALRALFGRLGLPWRPSTSKAARFFARLGAERA